jgi:predicted dehydrogenase
MVSELHQQAVVGSDFAHLVGVYDTQLQRVQARAHAWNVRAYRNLEELLADEAVDALYVLVPVEWHKEIVLRALQHCKHVFVEKPVAASVEEILEIALAAARYQRVVMPGHNYAYQPEARRAQSLISQGKLGRVCTSWITYAIEHSEAVSAHYHGVVREVLVHHLYLLLYLLGRPAEIWATQQSLHYEHLQQDDQGMIVARMPDGSMAQLFATWAVDDPTSDPWSFVVKVLGTQGGVTYSWRSAVIQRALGSLTIGFAPYEETFAYELEYFVTRCIGHGEQPLSTVLDAARVQFLVDCAAQSIAERRIVTVPEDPRLWP